VAPLPLLLIPLGGSGAAAAAAGAVSGSSGLFSLFALDVSTRLAVLYFFIGLLAFPAHVLNGLVSREWSPAAVQSSAGGFTKALGQLGASTADGSILIIAQLYGWSTVMWLLSLAAVLAGVTALPLWHITAESAAAATAQKLKASTEKATPGALAGRGEEEEEGAVGSGIVTTGKRSSRSAGMSTEFPAISKQLFDSFESMRAPEAAVVVVSPRTPAAAAPSGGAGRTPARSAGRNSARRAASSGPSPASSSASTASNSAQSPTAAAMPRAALERPAASAEAGAAAAAASAGGRSRAGSMTGTAGLSAYSMNPVTQLYGPLLRQAPALAGLPVLPRSRANSRAM
jgi:hypothetical protein